VVNTFFHDHAHVFTARLRPKWNRSCSHDSGLNRPSAFPAEAWDRQSGGFGGNNDAPDLEFSQCSTVRAGEWQDGMGDVQQMTPALSEDTDPEGSCISSGIPPIGDAPPADRSLPSQSKIEINIGGTSGPVAPSKVSGSLPSIGFLTCQVCSRTIAENEKVIMILAGGRRAYRCTELDTQAKKTCHQECLLSWGAHPKNCKQCVDWHKRGKCRKGFDCEFCHLPHKKK